MADQPIARREQWLQAMEQAYPFTEKQIADVLDFCINDWQMEESTAEIVTATVLDVAAEGYFVSPMDVVVASLTQGANIQ